MFNSEIFKYPESITEYSRIDQFPDLELADPSFALALDLGGAGAEESLSTLPQILYLSYKNHGQFILDCVKAQLRHPDVLIRQALNKKDLAYQAKAALENFSLALVSDESDTELWRRTARVAATLGSKRVSRYCLEAAVEVDDDPTVAEIDPSSLEEGFAGEQLKEQLEVLSDETALSHPIMRPFLKKTMPSYLTKYMDPYPFLPGTNDFQNREALNGEVPQIVENRTVIPAEQRTWTSVGDALCGAFMSPVGLTGTGIVVAIPQEQVAQPIAELESVVAPAEDQIMHDVGTTESPIVENNEATVSTPVTAKSDEVPVEVVTTTTTVPLADETSEKGLPTRKRSQSAAGIRETPEDDSGTQKRSKRIRNRHDTEGPVVDPATQYAEQMKNYVRADEDVFGFVHEILSRIGVEDLGPFSDLQAALSNIDTPDREETVKNIAVRDLRDILRMWDDSKASTFVNGNAADILGSSAASANAGLAAFLEYSKSGVQKASTIPPFSEGEGVPAFTAKAQANWAPLIDVMFDWLREILLSYRGTLWSEELKITVVRIISYADAELFEHLKQEIDCARSGDPKGSKLPELEDMTETLFELHLDIYTRITNPNSIVNYETRIMTKERVDRWADLTSEVVRAREDNLNDDLSVRHCWASVYYITMGDSVSREHKVFCWTDVQDSLRMSETAPIELQNNAVMPEISADAAEREVSRLTTMDFFFNLFQTDKSDPVAIIETLEPVLDPESACEQAELNEDTAASSDAADNTPATLRDMWKFLKTGSTPLRLFLWQRLREAYASIGYNTKVFSCNLKSIEIIVGDLRTDDYVDSSDEPRRHKLLTWLKALDDLLVKSLSVALNDSDRCFEIIDERHLKSTCAALAQLSRVLHSAAVFDDEIKVGVTQLPQTPAYNQHGSFNGFVNNLREMQVRTWSLQYTMVKESTNQNVELFTTPDKDLADFMANIHYCLGLRKCCKSSNKIFLRMMKIEMNRLKSVDRWEDYLGQVLYDLYGLRLGVGTFLLEEHGCPTEALDRRTVMNIAEQVVDLANKIPMKDLIKHELRTTIEKMQTAVGQAKSTPQMMHNLRNYTEYLKTSIRPLDMYKAFKGQVQVDSLPVITPESPLADKGWYFLLGMIALTKFRSTKRLGPGAQTDDMRVGATFMRLQLQFSADHWETWYRLAQCFDYELEEEVMWTADKINNHRSDLVRLQRGSIHCYIMALSTAVRTADDALSTAEKLSEMYHEFGIRLYASSREPFGMEAFWVDEFEKHMSGSTGMYKKHLHEEMSRYRVWKYAATLFRKSSAERPKHWMNHFMLGKCLWKMYRRANEEWDPAVQATKPSVDEVLRAFVTAVKTVPRPRDSRQEPILEPHYKLVSIVHKMVEAGSLDPQAAVDILQKQPYATRKGEPVQINGYTEWKPYVLDCLRHLRNLDKQHWHHRMIARYASIIYDENAFDKDQAEAARHEFRESIFTKTMHIQVWKPEAERPGRHCVYMERYVRYMTRILSLLNDKPNLEQLAKRVKKKSNDFFKFNEVWNDVCIAYLRLIRRVGNITSSMDEVFKSIPHDEFDLLSERLTAWIADPDKDHPALEALRETMELKKLNANQMKPAPIDDLINDAWAILYTQIATTLPGPDPPPQVDGSSESPAPRPMNPMGLNNLVMDMNGTQIPVPITLAVSGPHSRKTGISRREVLRRAEMAVNRIPEPPRAIAPRVVPSNDTSSAAARRASTPAAGQVAKDDSSAPGSLHDSADDESDLSDVPDMEDVEPASIFPNLMKKDKDKDAGSGAATPAAQE